MIKHLKNARKFAHEYNFDSGLEYNLCAIIVKGGNILSVGHNKRSTNAFVEHFADLARGERDCCLSAHAELDAICAARTKNDLRKSKIYVTRIKSSGELGMARPCPICELAIKSYGIKRAYYTIDNFHYGVTRPGNLEETKDQIIRHKFQDQL